MIMLVGLVTVYTNKREHSDKLQTFIYPEGMEEKFNKMMEGAKYDLPF